MLPVGSEDLDDGCNHHEDLDHPESRFATKLINGPTADEENEDEGGSISG